MVGKAAVAVVETAVAVAVEVETVAVAADMHSLVEDMVDMAACM